MQKERNEMENTKTNLERLEMALENARTVRRSVRQFMIC